MIEKLKKIETLKGLQGETKMLYTSLFLFFRNYNNTPIFFVCITVKNNSLYFTSIFGTIFVQTIVLWTQQVKNDSKGMCTLLFTVFFVVKAVPQK